jgi:hypothetical protein
LREKAQAPQIKKLTRYALQFDNAAVKSERSSPDPKDDEVSVLATSQHSEEFIR